MSTRKAPAKKAASAAPLPKFANQVEPFRQTVITLATTRAQIAQLSKARKAIHERLNDAYERGVRELRGGYTLKQTSAGEGSEYLAVSSAAAEKADKAAWQRAKMPKPFVQAKPPEQLAAVLRNDQWVAHIAPELPENADIEQAAAVYREHPAWDVLKQLRELEAECVERLDKLGAEFGWDGLPLVFSDGWTVGLKRMQFDSDRLYLVAPELFDRLAEVKVRNNGQRVYIGKIGENDEADEIDGE